MTDTSRRLARWLAALLLALAVVPALRAAVPNEDAVPAYAEEQTILQREQGTPEPGWWSLQSGRHHFDRHYLVPFGNQSETDLVLQRGGNTWRVLRNGPIAATSAAILLLTLLVLFVVWRTLGPARLPEPETGRRIQRFSAWQRLVHWSTAISFVLLALTGLIVLFGKKLLLPWMGHAAYAWLAIAAKWVHNIFGPIFIVCTIVMFVTFVKHNLFDRDDWVWIRKGGGLASHQPVPAGYFNAGEKVWFWAGLVFLGLVMSATGLVLDFVNFAPTRYLSQWANYLHLGGATCYIAALFGHVYIGTVGTPGTYEGMRHGTVGESWARTHHRHWYERVQRRGGGSA